MNDVRSFQNGNPLPIWYPSFPMHLLVAAPFCMASCLTSQVNGSCSSFVSHFVPCFPAVKLDPEMVNQRGFSMEIHRNPMRFRPSLPLPSPPASEDTIQEEGVDILRLDQAGQMQRWASWGFPMALVDHMQNSEIAMEDLENMSFCIFYPENARWHIRFFLGSDWSHGTSFTIFRDSQLL